MPSVSYRLDRFDMSGTKAHIDRTMRLIAKEAGYAMLVEVSREAYRSLTRESDGGDTNNMARALISEASDYYGEREAGHIQQIMLRLPSRHVLTNSRGGVFYGSGGQDEIERTFGFFSLDHFDEAIKIRKRADMSYEVEWMQSKAMDAADMATKVLRGRGKLSNYSRTRLNSGRIDEFIRELSYTAPLEAFRVAENLIDRFNRGGGSW